MDVFNSTSFRLCRLAARFRSNPEANRRRVSSEEAVSLVGQLMSDGLYAEEFVYLDDPDLNQFQMLPAMEKFLGRLNWKSLSDEEEFRFLTALYAKIGATDDISAYHAMRYWMDDVGHELGDKFHGEFVADGVGAERIYGCYYSYSNVTGADLIPSVEDPAVHEWKREGEARPKTVFAEWLDRNPKDFENYRPIDEQLLKSLSA